MLFWATLFIFCNKIILLCILCNRRIKTGSNFALLRIGVIRMPCNCSNNNWNIRNRRVLVVNGPTGATGPAGSNVISVNNAYLSTYGPVSVATFGDIPLTNNNVLNGTSITHNTGDAIVNLDIGTYIVNFCACCTLPIGQTVGSMALYLNGIMLPETAVLESGNAGDTVCFGGNAILQLDASGNIKLVNLTSGDTDFRRVMLTIVRLR